MKKPLLILLTLTFAVPFFLMAQETTKQKEAGLVSSNLSNFGLTFKTGTATSMWRFNTLIISGSDSEKSGDSTLSSLINAGFDIKIGKEFRKEISENFEFRYGVDLSFSYDRALTEEDDKSIADADHRQEQTTYQPGINLVLGMNYILNDNFVFGAELMPYFRYTTGTYTYMNHYNNGGREDKHDISGFNYGISNSSVLLSIAYRF